MIYSFTEKKRIRKEFGKLPGVMDTPYLLQIQLDSYSKYLQADTNPAASGAPADLVVVPDVGCGPAQTLLASRPCDLALVLIAGRPRLASPALAAALGLGAPNASVCGAARWLLGDVVALMERLRAAAGGVVEASPLWSMLGPVATPVATPLATPVTTAGGGGGS